jgi:L-threonate 2-dehydrogenase
MPQDPAAPVSVPAAAADRRRPVAILGVGAMGSAIAQRLLADGWRVTGVNPGTAALDLLRSLGGQPAADAAQAGRDSAAAIVCVNTAEAFFDVLLGEGGLVHGAAPGTVVLDICTLAEADKQRARQALARAGIVLLDCAVSGNRQSVLDGRLMAYVGGEPQAVEAVRPLLDALAAGVQHVGPFGTACRLKLVMNHLVCIHNAATAEAMAFGARLGLDPAQVHAVIAGSAAGSRIWDIRGRMMVQRDYRSSRGTFGMLHKDGPLILAAATADGGQAPLLELALALHRQADQMGYGTVDTAVLYEACRRVSGQPALEPDRC